MDRLVKRGSTAPWTYRIEPLFSGITTLGNSITLICFCNISGKLLVVPWIDNSKGCTYTWLVVFVFIDCLSIWLPKLSTPSLGTRKNKLLLERIKLWTSRGFVIFRRTETDLSLSATLSLSLSLSPLSSVPNPPIEVGLIIEPPVLWNCWVWVKHEW